MIYHFYVRKLKEDPYVYISSIKSDIKLSINDKLYLKDSTDRDDVILIRDIIWDLVNQAATVKCIKIIN